MLLLIQGKLQINIIITSVIENKDLPSLEAASRSSLSLLVLGLAERRARFAALSLAAERSNGECSAAPAPTRLRRNRPPRPTREIASNIC